MRIAFGPLAFLLPRKKWYEAIAISHRYADYYVDKALEHRKQFLLGKRALDVADSSQGRILLYNIAEKTGDRIYLRNQILQALMAAQDTTANLLGNVFFLLARHAEVWQRLRKEVLLIHDVLDYNQLIGWKYLQNVFKEGTLHYPPTSFIEFLNDTCS
jgi:cytochrome P450